MTYILQGVIILAAERHSSVEQVVGLISIAVIICLFIVRKGCKTRDHNLGSYKEFDQMWRSVVAKTM